MKELRKFFFSLLLLSVGKGNDFVDERTWKHVVGNMVTVFLLYGAHLLFKWDLNVSNFWYAAGLAFISWVLWTVREFIVSLASEGRNPVSKPDLFWNAIGSIASATVIYIII